MTWPTPQEYNEAVQNPYQNFCDPELQQGAVDTNVLGLPIVASGSFASVYRMRCELRNVAVRCFLKDIPDQQQRYEHISGILSKSWLPYTVSFEYRARGIRVNGSWFPILKMEWIYGLPLDLYVRQNIHDKQQIIAIAENFRTMMHTLNMAGIAHGDLQHGNILISKQGQCKLVDYDGMFVPNLRGFGAHDLGHRNYQHPAREHRHFNELLDNFSAWSIYTALLCLAEDPALIERLAGCDECLLFRQSDYRYPLRSLTFFTLETHDNQVIRMATRRFRSLLDRHMEAMPYLDEDPAVPENLPVLTNVFSDLPAGASTLPDQAAVRLSVFDAAEPQSYPMLNNYIHAVSNPAKSFLDTELKRSILALDHGSISPLVGECGAVFRLHGPGGQEIAIKVFFRPDMAREERYHIFKQFLAGDKPEIADLKPYIVDFQYQRNGIKINNLLFPILKMRWVQGETLFAAVESNKLRRESTRHIAKQFKQMMAVLRQTGIVHGDIDADNIIVTDNGLCLVDYDLIRTPLSMYTAINELGNRHFRHPKVKKPQADLNDNFSAWVVYTSLCLLAIQPDLWSQTGVKPGRLLFHQSDLVNPAKSLVFHLLEDHYAHAVRTMASQLKMFACWEAEHVPMLFDEPKAGPLPNLSPTSSDQMPIRRWAGSAQLPAQRRNMAERAWTIFAVGLTTALLWKVSPALGMTFCLIYLLWLLFRNSI